jgi:hypothetical protein
MLYREIMDVCSEINTKHINALCGQKVELLNVKLAVHIVTTCLQKAEPCCLHSVHLSFIPCIPLHSSQCTICSLCGRHKSNHLQNILFCPAISNILHTIHTPATQAHQTTSTHQTHTHICTNISK